MIIKEKAIKDLMDLGLTRQEAERSLIAPLAEHRKIVKGVQARLKAKSPIMLPHEGPPLPRYMRIIWPWWRG